MAAGLKIPSGVLHVCTNENVCINKFSKEENMFYLCVILACCLKSADVFPLNSVQCKDCIPSHLIITNEALNVTKP